MRRDEFEQIRADVQTAMIEGPQNDPSVTPEILFRLLDVLGAMAQEHCDCYPHGWTPDTVEGPQRHCPLHGEPSYWATLVLEDVQLRATSKIPYDEPPYDEPPEVPRV